LAIFVNLCSNPYGWELRNISNDGEDSTDKKRIQSLKVGPYHLEAMAGVSSTSVRRAQSRLFFHFLEVLTMTLYERETWIGATTSFLPKALARLRTRGNDQRLIPDLFP
jgi:hypothetical protein